MKTSKKNKRVKCCFNCKYWYDDAFVKGEGYCECKKLGYISVPKREFEGKGCTGFKYKTNKFK